MLKRWWFLEALRPAVPAQRSREMSKEAQQRILDEWEAARERLDRLVSARVTAVGDVLRTTELPLTDGLVASSVPDPLAQGDCAWAFDAFQAAGKLLDEAADLPDLAAAAVLADRALERFAAVHARAAGQPVTKPARRCFYNPLHTTAEEGHSPVRKQHRRQARRRTGPREAAADRRPACPACRKAILAGAGAGRAARAGAGETVAAAHGPGARAVLLGAAAVVAVVGLRLRGVRGRVALARAARRAPQTGGGCAQGVSHQRTGRWRTPRMSMPGSHSNCAGSAAS